MAPAHRKQVALGGEPFVVSLVLLGKTWIENLHLDAAREKRTNLRQPVTPGKDAAIARRFEMSPVEFQDEILVHPRGAHHADRQAGIDDHAVARREGILGTVHAHPARHIRAIEKRHKTGLLFRAQQCELTGCRECERQAGYREDPGAATVHFFFLFPMCR